MNFLQVATEAARAGGMILRENYGKVASEDIEVKSRNNFVTYIDRLSEEKIIEIIAAHFPDHGINAEEQGLMRTDSEYQWSIDPLDGTTNFIHSVPMFSVSIAVQKNEQLLAGVIYDPMRDELFSAERGKGAFLNGKRLNVTSKTALADCFFATGFPYREFQDVESYLRTFAHFMRQTAGIRRIGSAAIDLAYTAAGRFDGFWEFDLKPWDISAGILLIEEAGGKVSDPLGGNTYMETGNILASSNTIHEQMLSILKYLI